METRERNKVVDIIASVLVAIVLWAYVISVTNPLGTTVIKNVPVQLLNTSVMEKAGLAIAGSGEYTVDVVVGGTRTDRLNASAADFIATADVSALHIGQNYINVEVQSPANLSVDEIRVQNIQVYVDEKVSAEKPVRIISAGIAEAQEIGNVHLSVDKVVVSGAKSLVDTVKDVQLSVDVSKMAVEDVLNFKLPLVAVDSEGNKVHGVSLSQSEAEISATLFETKRVALNVPVSGAFAENIDLVSEIVPQAITIKGPHAALENIWSLDAGSIDLSAIKSSCKIPIVPVLPENIEVCRADLNLAVEYELLVTAEKSFEFDASEIEIRGLADGFKAEPLSSEKVFITFKGKQQTIDALQKDSVALYVDASIMQTGGSITMDILLDEASVQGIADSDKLEYRVNPVQFSIVVTPENAL